MEKIGEFAKRCEVTIKTLRYYDALGLLRPDFIDSFTGYRYYGPDKVGELKRINELKENGFSLTEIKRFCASTSEEERLQLVWEKRQHLEQQAAEVFRRLQTLAALEEKILANRGAIKMARESIMFDNQFENDERVIGRWEMIHIVERKEDFSPGSSDLQTDSAFKEIYFLPEGHSYWVFSWTKGFLKIHSGDGNMVCPYELEERGGEAYLFVSYDDKIWVLKQANQKQYTKAEIAQNDSIDLPFENDERVLGNWVALNFVRDIEHFDPDNPVGTLTLFYKSVSFLPNGVLRCVMGNAFEARWTKGVTLLNTGDGTTAPAYEIYTHNGTDYLFIQWKSGDYVYGDLKPYYYVFRREN